MQASLFLDQHRWLTRRYFLRFSMASCAALGLRPGLSLGQQRPPALEAAIEQLEPFFTPAAQFGDVSRGNPIPHSLAEEKKREVGLTRETWKLEVVSDPEHPVRMGAPLSKDTGTALDFMGLLQIAETRAVRFAKIMTCLNIGCPLGMGIWEGVPLRDIVWRAEPREDVRRVFYYGFHNDDPQQLFRSSLPLGRVLEDPYDLPPVILCYKLNGDWLDSQRGGPVRIVVPEAYGFKSIKWLSRIVLANLAHANDTYAEGNNDIDSPLKTFAATISVPREATAGEPIPVTGYAQVGISGLSKVQIALRSQEEDDNAEAGDAYLTKLPWQDVEILPPPKHWGAANQGAGNIPADTLGFSADGQPGKWPMRLGKVHWATLLPGQRAGAYVLRCRTIDEKGAAQPLPRPFRKSGHAAIETVEIQVRG